MDSRYQDVRSRDRIDILVHDLRNSLGSIILNLEISASPEYSSGIAQEAAIDALSEARRLRDAISGIRAAVDSANQEAKS
ncbi:MAG: hypothetical protein AAB229_01925 [Candidatus Hydrogenedentota bacterium]